MPWCVVGGWAIDCFLGHQTREHEDLEIAILHDDLPAVRHVLRDFVFHSVGDGQVTALRPDEEPLPGTHQTWVLEEAANAWRVDVMREHGDADTWVCRRDVSITAPRSWMVRRTDDGIPYLAGHGALLYKAKAARPKDVADLNVCLPALDAEERAWLCDALAVAHPGHAWLDRLA